MRGYLGFLLAASVLAGCAGGETVRTSWHGRNVAELITSWGPPSASYDQDDGGRYVLYRLKDEHLRYQGGDTSKALFAFRCVASFKTDGKGVIVSSDEEGSIGGCTRLLRDRPGASG